MELDVFFRDPKRRMPFRWIFKDSMSGIYSTSVTESTIDESPFVYKPMDEIMGNIKDTVEIVERITPIYNFKAH